MYDSDSKLKRASRSQQAQVYVEGRFCATSSRFLHFGAMIKFLVVHFCSTSSHFGHLPVDCELSEGHFCTTSSRFWHLCLSCCPFFGVLFCFFRRPPSEALLGLSWGHLVAIFGFMLGQLGVHVCTTSSCFLHFPAQATCQLLLSLSVALWLPKSIFARRHRVLWTTVAPRWPQDARKMAIFARHHRVFCTFQPKRLANFF